MHKVCFQKVLHSQQFHAWRQPTRRYSPHDIKKYYCHLYHTGVINAYNNDEFISHVRCICRQFSVNIRRTIEAGSIMSDKVHCLKMYDDN